MNKNKTNSCLWSEILVILCLLYSSCDPGYRQVEFKNCTKDTLFICMSQYNNIDSIHSRMSPGYSSSFFEEDTFFIDLFESNGFYIHNDEAILPDSTCWDYEDCLFYRSDTTYFFLIKWSDARKYTWDEIRKNKLYRKWIVTRDKNGEYDTNIRYLDSDEQE